MDELGNKLLNGSIDTSSTVNNLLSGTGDPSAKIGQGIPNTGFFSGFTIETIMVGIVASIMGAYYLKIGKKNGKIIMLLCGIALLGITYFIKNIRYLGGTALVLAIIPIFKKG